MKSYVPSVSSNPVKLAMRLLVNRNPAARSALFLTAAGIVLSPLDFLLKRYEHKIYERSQNKTVHLVMVCGPPRSGTTLVAQYLINSLEVSYINNLASLFPQSPVVINHWLRRFVQPRLGNYQAFYGRSQRLAGVNDGLQIWDRWLGSQRDELPVTLQPDAQIGIRQFFAAWLDKFGTPCVNKVNRLIGCLNLVAPMLPDSIFVYLQRDPVMLAQSLLIARNEIGGDSNHNYGLAHPDRCHDDPIEDVCRQVEFYMQLQKQYASGALKNRIVFVEYEKFCNNPAQLLDRLDSVLPFPVTRRGVPDSNLSFKVSDSTRLPEEQIRRIRERLARPLLKDR